jgi:AAA15 family ATPase/GTPase
VIAMQIQSIAANNFKSLIEFQLDLARFNCLIGLNGSGKSTVLQLIDFLAQLVRGDLKGWLEARHWKAQELHSQFSSKKNIRFTMYLGTGKHNTELSWRGLLQSHAAPLHFRAHRNPGCHA